MFVFAKVTSLSLDPGLKSGHDLIQMSTLLFYGIRIFGGRCRRGLLYIININVLYLV